MRKNISINRSTKILVVPGWFPSSVSPFNGDFIQTQVMLLRKLLWKVDLVYADLSWQNLKSAKFRRVMSQSIDSFGNITQVLSGPFPPKRLFGFEQKWLKIFELLIENYIRDHGPPHILHAHTYLGGVVAARIKERFKIPVVITEHFSGLIDGTIRPEHISMAKCAYQSADQTIAVSNALSDAIFSLSGIRSTVIPNFIDVEQFNPGEKENDQIYISFVGDLIPRKRPQLLIEAFLLASEKDPSLRLNVVGKGPEANACQRLLAGSGFENHVHFYGQLSASRVAEVIRNSHLLVLPSKTETFGLVLVEALSCGVPVISFYNGGASDIINSVSGLLINIENEQTLSSAILEMAHNLNRYPTAHLRKYAKDNFSAAAVGPRLYMLFSEVVQNSSQWTR